MSPLLNVCPAGVEKVFDDVCAAVPAGQEERSASFGSLLAGDLAAVLMTELFHLPPELVGKPIPRSGKLAFGDQISKQVLSNLSEITIFSIRHFMQLQTQNNVR